jgi:hypothetical protein
MVRFGGFSRVLLYLVAFLLVQEASGGKLRDLEKKVSSKSESKEEKEKKTAHAQSYGDSFGTGTYPSDDDDSFMGWLIGWFVAAPFRYRHDDPSAGFLPDDGVFEDEYGESASRFPKHELGQATVPYARIDYNWQYVDSDIDADDVRVEVGYKLLAFHGRHTRYKDSSDGFTLDFNQYFGVLRYGGFRPDFLPGTFEAGIGFGVSQIDGDDKDSGGALTIPLKYYPVDWCGIEFRPAWYRWMDLDVGDYDLSISAGYRYVQLRGGYRWMHIEDIGNANNGPYAGVSMSF